MSRTLNLELAFTVRIGSKNLGKIVERSTMTLDERTLGKLPWVVLWLAMTLARGGFQIMEER